MSRISSRLWCSSAIVMTLLGSSPAWAAICAVPTEVIQRTVELDGKVTAQIVKSKTLLITEEMRQRQLLLAALKVVTRQESGSGQQTAMVTKQSAEAGAAAHVAQRQAYAIADAKERYQATGYDACGLAVKAKAFYTANKSMDAKAASYAAGTTFQPGQWGSPAAWTSLAKSGDNTDAEALFKGDSGAAKKYIDFVAGPPMEKPAAEGAGLQVATLEKYRSDARRSLAVTIMSSIAAENEPNGPRQKLEEMTKHWTGKDGGEAWAKSMADKPERAALLDAVRIEAANIAMMAFQVKDSARTELSLSGYALARINAIVFNERGGAVISAPPGQSQRASLK